MFRLTSLLVLSIAFLGTACDRILPGVPDSLTEPGCTIGQYDCEPPPPPPPPPPPEPTNIK